MKQIKITKEITNRREKSVDKYLNEVSKIPLITPEEEVALAQRIKSGDHAALQELVRANLRFVVSVAKKYQNSGMLLSDLINEGNLGLIKAAQRFDTTRGFKFISYAVWWIRQSIIQALSEQVRIVRLPLNQVNNINQGNKIFHQLEQELEREPTDAEIAEMAGITEKLYHSIKGLSDRHISLDTPITSDSTANMIDLMSRDEDHEFGQMNRDSLLSDLNIVFRDLTDRERKVVSMYFGLPPYHHRRSLDEIGAAFGLTRERARQLKDTAIRKCGKLKHRSRLRKYR